MYLEFITFRQQYDYVFDLSEQVLEGDATGGALLFLPGPPPHRGPETSQNKNGHG